MRFAHSLSLPAALLLAGGCAPADSDGDLFTDDFELLIGTNPDSADSDGDGFDDVTEYLSYFDPNKASDFPYESDYARYPLPSADAWDELKADAGWAEGDFSRSWAGVDQNEVELLLKRFYGQVALIDISAEWCGPCRAAAENLEEEWRDRLDDGFIAFTMLTEDPEGNPTPSAERWASDFGLTLPIIEDGSREISDHYLTTAYPTYSYIARDFTIQRLDQQGGTPDLALIEDMLNEPLPAIDYPMPADYLELQETLGLNVPEVDYMEFNVVEDIPTGGGSGGSDGAPATPSGSPFGGA